jgi:hypothetical protein
MFFQVAEQIRKWVAIPIQGLQERDMHLFEPKLGALITNNLGTTGADAEH